MSMQTIPRSPVASRSGSPKGTWFALTTSNPAFPLEVVLICPGCGQSMGILHAVGTDGTVNPSVVCPYTEAPYGCAFHEFVRLADWDHGPKPERRLHG